MKNGQTPGPGRIPVELIKNASRNIQERMYLQYMIFIWCLNGGGSKQGNKTSHYKKRWWQKNKNYYGNCVGLPEGYNNITLEFQIFAIYVNE